MEDIVGVIVTDSVRGKGGFVTRGRLFHPVDETELIAVLRSRIGQYGFKNVEDVTICNSLQDIATAEYFYEALIHFAWRPKVFGPESFAWEERARDALRAGRDIYFVGALDRVKKSSIGTVPRSGSDV